MELVEPNEEQEVTEKEPEAEELMKIEGGKE